MKKLLPIAMAKSFPEMYVFIHSSSSRARTEPQNELPELYNLAALPSKMAMLLLSNHHGQNIHDIVRFLLLLFEAELELGQLFAFQNQLFQLSNVVAIPPTMMKRLPITMAKTYLLS